MTPSKGQSFALNIVQFAMQSLMDGLSLRQVELVLGRVGAWFGFDGPDFSTVRLWALRVGLFLWQRTPPRADDWIWIVDHVAESGGGKCLTILGVRRSQLRGGDFALQHTDVTVLFMKVMPTSTGDAMFEIFVALAAVSGVPVQIVSDHGSDVFKGERLFHAQHPGIDVTWDCTHFHARRLLAAIKDDEVWALLKWSCQQTRLTVQRTPFAALSPPSTTGASRCEHLDKLTLWGVKTLAKLDAGAVAVLDDEHCYDAEAANTVRAELSPTVARSLKSLADRSFPNAATFTAALTETVGAEAQPSLSAAQITAIRRASHRGQRRADQHFAWLEAFRSPLTEIYEPLVQMVYSAEQQIKQAGLHCHSATDWLATQPPLPKSWTRARRFRAQLLRHLRQTGRTPLPDGHYRPRDQALLATSDVLESLFGKYKRYTERSPQTPLTSAILTLPLATEPLTPTLLAEALESVGVKHLYHWCQQTFGRTKLATQRLLTHLLPGTKPA